ncbi:MAG: sugar phosphate isomerase/epimerase family protein [Huintestinicola sp.]
MSRFFIIPDPKAIDESIALAEEYGFGFEYNDFYLPSVLDSTQEVDRIAAMYHSRKVPEHCTIHGDFFDVIVFSVDKLIREVAEMRIRQSITAAEKVGAEGVVFHTNHSPQLTSESYVNGWINSNHKFWDRILNEYPDMNIYIENMFDSSPDMLAALAEKLKHHKNFGVCLDYSHAVAFGTVEIGEWVNKLHPYVKHLHLNDNDLKNDLHLPVGDGKIDWIEFRDYYNKYFTDCSVLIELTSLYGQRRSAEYLRALGILE